MIITNARSLKPKFAHLQQLLENIHADIVVVCESWFRDDDNPEDYNLNGYFLLRCDRWLGRKKTGGGLCCYVNSKAWGFESDIIDLDTHTCKDCEILQFAMVQTKGNLFKPVIWAFTFVYNPKGSECLRLKPLLMKRLDLQRCQIERNYKKCPIAQMVAGDFNDCHFLIEEFIQHINIPTRKPSESTIDLMFTNFKCNFKCSNKGQLQPDDCKKGVPSDHFIIHCKPGKGRLFFILNLNNRYQYLFLLHV